MSWMGKLYETYETQFGSIGNLNDPNNLLPLYHSRQKAQLNVVLDGEGSFVRASVVPKDESQTIIPASEESAGRSGSTIAPHPLCDTLQYVAGDYLVWGGNPRKKKNESGHERYMALLMRWAEWSGNMKLRAVCTYLQKGRLIGDLVMNHILCDDGTGRLMDSWTGQESESPPIFAAIKQANKKGQCEAFVRFSVEIPGDPQSDLWKDLILRDSWSNYYASIPISKGLCIVTGEERTLASNHPKNIRYPGDGAKLISSNDQDGFTFLGRFKSDKEACAVGLETTHKAHNILRWLIGRQGYRNGDQVIVSWAISGAQLPDPFKNTRGLFNELLVDGSLDPTLAQSETFQATDVGQTFALKLKSKIAGYKSELGPTEGIVVMGLDSATPGRMSITYYRQLSGSEFLDRIEDWHQALAWPLRFSVKDTTAKKRRNIKIWSVCAPAPVEIAKVCYGRRLDDQLGKKTVERLLPCIVDGAAIPGDLVESALRRATNRGGLEQWEWEMGIACSLYKGYYFRNPKEIRRYSMALEPDRNTRDYLYGRLLAIAEHMEHRALYVAGERRDTTAAKLMQRFADRPFSTWKTIELSLTPYKTRLRAKRPGFLYEMETLLNEVHSKMMISDYLNDARLTGEYLLGYHCQQRVLREKQSDEKNVPEGFGNEGE